jgi:group I intron endonuclease
MKNIGKEWIEGADYSLTPSVFKSHFGDSLNYSFWFNLRSLWTKDINTFITDEIGWENVIYAMVNQINGKIYIGQAKDYFQRWVSGGTFSHYDEWIDGNDTVLYRAINKYGLENFRVYCIEEVDQPDDSSLQNKLLNDREIYYINFTHSFIHDKCAWGYNMTTGGNNSEILHMPWVVKRQVRSNYNNHNGVLSFNTTDSISKRLETNIKKYNGDSMGMCHTPEAILKSKEVNRLNHGGVLSINTPDSMRKSQNTRNRLYGGNGAGAMHTPEARAKANDTCIERYGNIMGQCHTPEARAKANDTCIERYGKSSIELALDEAKLPWVRMKAGLTMVSSSIKNHENLLIDNGIPLTIYNFIMKSPDPNNHHFINNTWEHWAGCEEFYKDDRISDFMKSVLKFLEKFTSWDSMIMELSNSNNKYE